MIAAPLAALDLPLRVLVRVREDGQTAIAFHPIGAVLRRAGVPEALAGRLDGAQRLDCFAAADAATRNDAVAAFRLEQNRSRFSSCPGLTRASNAASGLRWIAGSSPAMT